MICNKAFLKYIIGCQEKQIEQNLTTHTHTPVVRQATQTKKNDQKTPYLIETLPSAARATVSLLDNDCSDSSFTLSRFSTACICCLISGCEFIMAINKKSNEEQARKSLERACRLENEFMEYFTSIVEGDNIDALYDSVKKIIVDHSTKTIWVASNENF